MTDKMPKPGLKILHLTLHRKWFDAIRSGQKKEEHRANTPYYWSRLSGRTYDEIRFVNGYGKDRPFMRVECEHIYFRNQRWVIQLGKILETGNLPPPGGGDKMKVYYYTILVTIAGFTKDKAEHELKSQAEAIAKKIKTCPGVGAATIQLKSKIITDNLSLKEAP